MVKIISKRTETDRFPLTNYLYVKDTDILICKKCVNPIKNNDYAFVCRDFDKIWHENCFEQDHTKKVFQIIGSVKQHGDMLVTVKIMPIDVYDSFEMNEISINV